MTSPPAPTLRTDRLVIRPLTENDQEQVFLLAGDALLADTLPSLPHPYTRSHARTFVKTSARQIRNGERYTLAIELIAESTLIGAVTVGMDAARRIGSLGYWIGVAWWGRGYATEAASAVLRWAFETLPVVEIQSSYLRRNPASGRVIRKLGMWYWRTTVDILRSTEETVEHFVLTRDDWIALAQRAKRTRSGR